MAANNPSVIIVIGLAAIVGLLAAVIAIGLNRVTIIEDHLEQVVNEHNMQFALSARMIYLARERIMMLNKLVTSDDPFERDEYFIALREAGSEFIELREKLLTLNLDSEEKALLNAQGQATTPSIALQYEVLELSDQNRLEEAHQLLFERTIPAQSKVVEALQKFTDLQHEHNQRALDESAAAFRTISDLMLALFATVMLMSMAIGSFVVRRITLISSNLEHTSRRLREANASLQRSRDELEQQVADRTAALEQANTRLQQMANYDHLTGLPNRALIMEHLKLATADAHRSGQLLAVMFLDMDGFKRVNDSLGHEAGDQLLTELAARLRSCVRENDSVGRFGGDEFIVLLSALNSPIDVTTVAEKILGRLAEPVPLKGEEAVIGCSIGIALYPSHTTDLDDLIKKADLAMYTVKNGGKNNYGFFAPPGPGA